MSSRCGCECSVDETEAVCESSSQLFDADDDYISSSCLLAAAEPRTTSVHSFLILFRQPCTKHPADDDRGVYPPLPPWSKVPPPLPLPLPLEVGPLIAARGSGECFSSPSGSGRSPAAKWYSVNFRLTISPLVATIFRNLGGKCINN